MSSHSEPPVDWQIDAARTEDGLNCLQKTYDGLDLEKKAGNPLEILNLFSRAAWMISICGTVKAPPPHCGFDI